VRRLELLLARVRRDPFLRGVALYLAIIGPLALALRFALSAYLSPEAEAGLDAALLALVAGGFIFVLVQGSLRRGEDEIQALRSDSERFRSLTALTADWFWESDAEHRITWVSGGAPVMMIFGQGAVYGKRFWEAPGVEVASESLTHHLEQIATHQPFFDLEIARSDERGARVVHIVSGQARVDAEGRFLGYRGVGRDVTEQRRAERALSEAKERVELALEGGSLATWDFDLEMGVTHFGTGWARLLGRKPSSDDADIAAVLAEVHPDDRAGVRETFVKTLKGEVPAFSAEYRMRDAVGDWRWLQSAGRVILRGADGRARRVSGTTGDIEARKRADQAVREAEQRYRSLIELQPDGVIVHSGGLIEYANQAAARIVRAGSPRQLIGLPLEKFVQPEERERFRERLQYLLAGPGSTRFEERRLRGLDGADILVEAAGVSYLERGRLVVQSLVRDVSEQRKAREQLAEREQRFRDVVEAAGEYVWETDAEWRYSYLSARVEHVMGYLRHEMLGRRPQDFMALGEARAHEEWFERRAREAQPFRDLVFRAVTKTGGAIWLSVSGMPVLDAAGRLKGYRGTGADITARKQAEQRIEYLATRDALTGLPNKLLLADRAGQAILAAARGRTRLAVLLFDLDRFNLVNDSLGHQAGDALLRAVAERLANTLRREDTLARLGGDEFVLVWNGLKGAEDAALVAQRILDVLARPFTVEGRTLNVAASIGISVYPDDGRDFAALLKNADAAMYHAKESGRGTFRLASPALMERALERLRTENELRRALTRGELVLHYQPVVRGRPEAGGRVVGAEVLVRWQHPERGLLLPEEFIPLAEESGLIRAIGEWTLERALSQIGAWQRSLPAGGPWFAVNVSATELAQGEAFVARLRAALAANGVDGRSIELELTERSLMAHFAENAETLRRIGELGVRCAIDDFGTGYSSLAYLRRLPIDKLKIDRSFLRELATHSADESIVRTITAMARTLGLAVVAEGVESAAQLERVLALGCEEWQGHYYSMPLEAADFEQLIRRREAAAS
jgi:diguanylate cyclase (GGDEF)-like protein/PAS domain S-box-containing protein